MPRRARERRILVERDHDWLSIRRQAQLLGISRASVYAEPLPPTEKDIRLYDALDRLYTVYPYFGQRKLSAMLLGEDGIRAGRDRIRSAMAVLGLETLYPKPKTSEPHPNHETYPYLLRHISAEKPNHIWGVDITYIKLSKGYCYLVAMLDWYSRYVLSWRISETMETAFCIETLAEALKENRPPLFHNSDQGSQFTSREYLAILQAHPDIQISMDGRGRCMDNIFTERLWRSVKYENVYINEYATANEARDGIGTYLKFYNEKRPHQSLKYKTPREIYDQKHS